MMYFIVILLSRIQVKTYEQLAWEPSVAHVTHSYSRCLPALDRTLRFKLRTFPWISQVPQSKLRQFGHGVSELWTDKQTDWQTEIIYIYIGILQVLQSIVYNCSNLTEYSSGPGVYCIKLFKFDRVFSRSWSLLYKTVQVSPSILQVLKSIV